VFNALGRDESIGHFLDYRGFSFQHEHFQAIVVIEVHMQCGKDRVIALVLHFGEPIRQHSDVVIVDQRYGSDDDTIRTLRRFSNQSVTNKIAERFGAICIAALRDQMVEFLKEFGVDGDSDPAELAHSYLAWHIFEKRDTNKERMHIPDGFLSPPVWGTFDVLAAPAVGWIARRAQRGMDDRNLPLLGVMGAFVFAAQMINFPVGLGTSGHLVGGTLLAIVLGPAAAAMVMTGIITIQALVFQDGGIIALGANVVNMAVAGVLAGYLPYRFWSATSRSAAIFIGGVLSVLTSAGLALSELLTSGVPMPQRILFVSLGLFLVSAIIEGAITLAAVRAIERFNPAWVRGTAPGSRVIGWVAIAAVVLAVGGILVTSTDPDGIQKLASAHSSTWLHAPLGDYQIHGIDSPWLRRAAAGLAGLALIYGVCALTGKLLARPRSS
jgi:cobalt/nickel transport system permease protein